MPLPILIIDDSPSIRALTRSALEREKYVVVEATDGQDAMDKLDGRPLGLIVSDLCMPRVDGLGFLRYLRLHPRYQSTPLVLLTTETRPEVKQAAREQGAQGFITKPFTAAQLVAAAKRLCR
jgi:two-component system chemotaxis response regulator CheY